MEDIYNYIKENYPTIIQQHTYIEHPQGWNNLVISLIEELKNYLGESFKDIHITQTKEKFGGLRFYISLSVEYDDTRITKTIWDGIYKIIYKYESESFNTCEQCGTNENIKTKSDRYWIHTLCDNCREKRNNQ